ncbi:hypothetical protein [Streptomyces sp. NPDC059209]|uniref:hypothetical protein n=1 Tax=Streptomyces sp. NPDC059209 TaxID=3346769 RepID=UPI0036BBE65E
MSQAFQDGGPVPSEQTVMALGRVLRLPVTELLELRRAAEAGGHRGAAGPGRPITQWDPHDLEVHPAGHAPGTHPSEASGRPVLPSYVRREHDEILSQAVSDASEGRSRILVLVGTSSTGKTRACWEAVQPLAELGWWLWHPFDPTRADAALEELQRVQPRTVVWLNEAQHYLADPTLGERIAAAVHALLTDVGRGPVLVLGTLWPEYVDQYTARAFPGASDLHSRARELLAGRTVAVPDRFDTNALAGAAALAEGGDLLRADALTRAHTNGYLTQDLAGAPQLLRRFQHASPAARAVLEAAMDARRLGVGLHMPQAFLTDAASDYLTDRDYEQLPAGWADAAFAELSRLDHGRQAPLSRAQPRPPRHPPGTPPTSHPTRGPAVPEFRLADFLEHHGRTTRRHRCPPTSFWHAAYTHLTNADDLTHLTNAAILRHRLQWAHHLSDRPVTARSTDALPPLTETRETSGNVSGILVPAPPVADHRDSGALLDLARTRDEAGDREGAEAMAREAADYGSTTALLSLALMRDKAGDHEGAESLARQAADYGSTISVLLNMRWPHGLDPDGTPSLPWG